MWRRTHHRRVSVSLWLLVLVPALLLGGCKSLRPPPPPPPVAQEPAPPHPVKKRIVLRSVYFNFNSSKLRPDALPVLDEAVRTLRDEPELPVVTEGHTDSKESKTQALSERRAAAVRDYFVEHGIAASRVESKGFGGSRPVASNQTADGRAGNRRVELKVGY